MSSERSISTEVWVLRGAQAQLTCGALRAELDVERPTRGLRELRLAGETLAGWLMAVDVVDDDATEQPWQPADVYTRGSDLVATYREPLGQPFSLQVYWRALAPKDREVAALEAILSIQTREWEAHPFVSLDSAIAVDRSRLENGGVIFHSQHDWSYVEATPPGDFTAAVRLSTTEGLSESRWTYGNHFMERGVIRRLRLRGAFVSAMESADAVEQMRTDLLAEPPPLTA